MEQKIPDNLIKRLERLIAIEHGKREIGDPASINEAEAFALKIQELLLQYNLTKTDVEWEARKLGKDMGQEFWDPSVWGTKDLKRRSQWREDLALIVANAHLCRLLVITNSNQLFFVGREGDRKCAVYAYTVLMRFAEKWSRYETRKLRREHRAEYGTAAKVYGWREAWLRGFTIRIGERYQEAEEALVERVAMQSNMMGFGGSQMSLVARIAEARAEAQEFITATYGDSKPVEGLDVKKVRIDGMQSGYKAGDRVDLGIKGVEPTAPLKQIP